MKLGTAHVRFGRRSIGSLGTLILTLMPMVMTGQMVRERLHEEVLLKNWPTPLHWQPTPAERQVAATASSPELQFPGALSTDALSFVAMTPCRVVDTRNAPGPLGGPILSAGVVRTFNIQSSVPCPIPAIAQAYSLNITVVPTGTLGFLTVAPTPMNVTCGGPCFSTLNDPLGIVIANAAIVPAGTPNGSIDVYPLNQTHVIIDINGYFAAPTDNKNLNGNTALGFQSLFSTTPSTAGIQNTAVGWAAGHDNTAGAQNTFMGNGSGYSNNGSFNTFTGTEAGYWKTSGDDNAFYGYRAGYRNYTGSFNSYLGTAAGFYNDGSNNTFVGFDAGWNPCGIGCVGTGSDNTFVGWEAGFYNINGNHNTYVGENAGKNPTNTNGNNNTYIGDSAGSSSTGNNNLYLAHVGVAAAESNTTRIGNVQLNAYMAGIWNVMIPNGVPVLIDANGHLGTIPSSRRYKEDIQDMGLSSSDLMRLRPVTFRYKKASDDGSKPLDYGLIAEEVGEVYPDLVARGTDGQIETVQYHKLTPMLLNEIQKQNETIRLMQARLTALEALLSSKVQSTAAGQ